MYVYIYVHTYIHTYVYTYIVDMCVHIYTIYNSNERDTPPPDE